MKFWSFYSKRLIAGISRDKLADILTGINEDVTAKVINNGSILLSGKINKVIKCVSEYYDPVNDPGITPIKSSNAMIRCQNTRERLGLSVSRMDCLHCQRLCMRLHTEDRLKRKDIK